MLPRKRWSFVESVDALSADEALLLARELPHLRGLINGDLPGIDRDTARTLALGVLNVAQGHPKLLELANGQAAHPERLAGLVAAGDQAWRDQGGLPDGFFTTGETAADPGDYLHVLAAWTNAVTDTPVPRRTRPVLVPVLPGRTRPRTASPRRQSGPACGSGSAVTASHPPWTRHSKPSPILAWWQGWPEPMKKMSSTRSIPASLPPGAPVQGSPSRTRWMQQLPSSGAPDWNTRLVKPAKAT